jgi:hypothetical protein
MECILLIVCHIVFMEPNTWKGNISPCDFTQRKVLEIGSRTINKAYNVLGGSPCHHGMARPRVADGRNGLQLEVSCEYIE